MTGTSWIEKYRPESFESIQGNTTAIESIEEWAEDWQDGDAPQLLVGPPGTGKTTTAYVTAEVLNLDLNEVNASSARKTEDVARVAEEIQAGEQLVLLDEVDSWHHAVNLQPLREELKEPSNPVVMTANEKYDVPYALKDPATVHDFSLSKASRRAKLKDIVAAEGIPIDQKDLERLVQRPDLRSAINDLQLHAEVGLPIGEDGREWESSEFDLMEEIIQEGKAKTGDTDPGSLIHWLDQNLPKDYRGLELAYALDALSRADTFLGRAGEGDYRGWRYAAELEGWTARLRRTDAYQGYIRWEFPEWFRASTPKPTEDSEEAELWRELNDYGVTRRDGKRVLSDRQPGTNISGDYLHFREALLPVLRAQPADVREQIASDYTLPEGAASALGVDTADYDASGVEAGEGLSKSTDDSMEVDW